MTQEFAFQSGALCCPGCEGELAETSPGTLSCLGCGGRFPLTEERLASFSDPGAYWGEEFSLEEMREINALARAQEVSPEPTDLRASLARMESVLRRLVGPGVELVLHLGNEPAIAHTAS
ncbi:MAG: hypothetical protein HUU16_14035, partial [Candidatus Omnitrophica bacterium]|nr:hypothetical protein [Candidatus Omnitrophota bacterium]